MIHFAFRNELIEASPATAIEMAIIVGPSVPVMLELAVIEYHYRFMASTNSDSTTRSDRWTIGSDRWTIIAGSWLQPTVIAQPTIIGGLSLLVHGFNRQ